MEIFRVSGVSRPTKVAGFIAGMIREGKQVQAHAIGAAAVNQARPASAKGKFVKSSYISSTMGPGVKLDVNALATGRE